MWRAREQAQQYLAVHADQNGTIMVGGTGVRYHWAGDPAKQLVVFVHGSPGSWEAWAGFLSDKALQRDFFLVAIDRPGYGGTEPGRTERSLARQGEAARSVFGLSKNPAPPILVGHSYGGPVAVQAAAQDPDRVGGVVLIAGSVDPALEVTKWYQIPADRWPLNRLIPTDLRVCNEEILALKSQLVDLASDPIWRNARFAVVHGEDDSLVPAGNADFVRTRVPPERLIDFRLIQGMGHFIPWQKPELIVEAIRKLASTQDPDAN
jgi:pimeloyl-ACP methyl ester carboxylesterase